MITRGATVREACNKPGMPSYGTVCRWLRERPEFRRHYYEALEDRGHLDLEDLRRVEQLLLLNIDPASLMNGGNPAPLDQHRIKAILGAAGIRQWRLGARQSPVIGSVRTGKPADDDVEQRPPKAWVGYTPDDLLHELRAEDDEDDDEDGQDDDQRPGPPAVEHRPEDGAGGRCAGSDDRD